MAPRPVLITLLAVAALAVSSCSSPTPISGGGGDGGGTPAPAPADLPAWYGTQLDADGCPVPQADSGLDVFPDAAAFLQTDVPAGWCMYSTIDYVEYYAIPAAPSAGFDADVRGALGPAGWEFDAADDDSPQWSWITAFPAGAEKGFDGSVDGAILTVDSAASDDIDNYSIWFSSLIGAFGGTWSEGDQIRVLGFW
ncbi:MAG: hypothetical protein ACTHKX_06640 [Pseudolysinimonas sp.]